ncbi:MAG: aminotransferase class V-fold PLP-dependent enzyme [Clostridiales bacterium]|nr:aminotransferase class V-fold PLP-dependent enzyme [Clostridiales bacterium]
MDERRTTTWDTLQEALGAYERGDSVRFHMPGHKGRGMNGFWRDELLLWDVTELSGTDNLHAPHGAIAGAQRQMANAYGAKASFFVVNGGTNAVQAMILALGEHDKLLLARDCHRSAVSGAALRGIETCYVSPRYDEARGLLGMVTPEDLDRALKETGATVALITSPNAYGFCADVKGLAEAAHRNGALLLVDSAHGAHYPFSDALPQSLGGVADLFAHSQHKTMDALTQAASLHLGDCRISEDRVRRALAMTETTSPSYLLMASLDWSVYMARRRDWTGQVRRCMELEEKIEAIDGLRVFHDPIGIGVYERDRTRLVIDVTGRGTTGYEAQAKLEERGIYFEMADLRRLVLITTPNDEPDWYERLLESLAALPERSPILTKSAAEEIRVAGNRQCASIREATFAESEAIPLARADGRIATEPIGIYPPGIALVMPGETIDRRAIEYLTAEERGGGALFGVRDGRVFVMKEMGDEHAGTTA